VCARPMYHRSRAELDPTDFRSFGLPRLSEENLPRNLLLVDAATAMAARRGCTAGQLALAWLHAQGRDVIPIPGTTSVKHMEENLAAREIVLSAEEMAELNEIFTPDAAVGARTAHMAMTFHGNKSAGGH
jgi:aryl-alcohol dehydrogenase-like predicted oxidoreductase